MKKVLIVSAFALLTGCGQLVDQTPPQAVTAFDLTSQKKAQLVEFYVAEYRASYNADAKKELLETITAIGRGEAKAAQFLIDEYRASYNADFKRQLILLMGQVSHDLAADYLLQEYRASYNAEQKALIRRALMEAAKDRPGS